MGWLNKILGKPDAAPALEMAPIASIAEPSPVTQTVVAKVDRPVIDHAALVSANLGFGHWAMTAQGVGIVTGCEGGVATVNLCKPDGTNKMVLNEEDKAVVAQFKGPLGDIRRAFIGEIPNRNPDVADYNAHMRKFGYRCSSESEV